MVKGGRSGEDEYRLQISINFSISKLPERSERGAEVSEEEYLSAVTQKFTIASGFLETELRETGKRITRGQNGSTTIDSLEQ